MADWNALYSNQGIKLQGNPALQELQSGIIQQRKQQAVDNKDYAAQVAKLNFGGAKDADLDYLHKQYGGILNTFGELRNNNNPRDRAALGQKLQQQQNEFLYNIEKSKQANKQEMDLTDLPLRPNANLEEGATDRILGLTKVSTFDPSRDKVYRETVGTLFAPKPVDWNKETSTLFKGLVDKSTNTAIERDPVTGMLVNKRTVASGVDKNAYMSGVMNMLKNPEVLRAAKRDFGGGTEAEVAKKIADNTYDNYAKTLGTDVTTGNPFETPAQRDARSLAKQKAFALWKEANIGDGGGGVASAKPAVIPYLNGKARVDVPDYVPLSIPKKNFAGSPAYNLTDGKRVPSLESSGDYAIIGVGSFPFVKSGSKVSGEIAQPNFVRDHPNDVEYLPMVHVKSPQTSDTEQQDFIIDFDRLPENVKNSKAVKQAVGGIGRKQVAAPTQKTAKSVSGVRGTNKSIW